MKKLLAVMIGVLMLTAVASVSQAQWVGVGFGRGWGKWG